jgi:hypothetical protein
MAYLRSPTITYTTQNTAPFNLYTAQGQFDITIPADWDNTVFSPTLDINVVGGIVCPGDPPLGLNMLVKFEFATVDGGSIITAATSPDGFSYLPGAVTNVWGTASSSPITTAGLDQTFSTISISPNEISGGNDVLIDGTAYGFPGDGFGTGFAPVPSAIQGPIGWVPNIYQTNADAGVKLVAGQTATLGVTIYFTIDDNTFPDREAYGAIQSISYTYNGTTVSVPITSVYVGFGGGGPVLPYPPAEYDNTPIDFNPLRLVEATVPPIAYSGQDLFLEGVVETMVYFVPPGKQTFIDPATGDVAALGTVGMYQPDLTDDPPIAKDSWSNEAATELNTVPIQLDGGGQCIIWGSGLYRQIFKLADGSTVWDKITGG